MKNKKFIMDMLKRFETALFHGCKFLCSFFIFSPLFCNLSGSNGFGCCFQVALGNFLIHKLSGLCFFFLLLHRVPRFLVGAPVPLWGCTDL